MDFLEQAFKALMYTITFIAFLSSFYYAILALFSLREKKREPFEQGKRKFAFVIPAHNEKLVIANTIEACLHLDYPRELFNIYVIADNCTDETKQIAEKAGAIVYERQDPKGGKGYALNWFFDEHPSLHDDYRSVVILDADNIVARDFLENMNRKMNEGYKVVQGYLDSKNPYDSFIAGWNSIEFWISNRMLKLSRDNIGVSAQLGGTGFAVDTDLLEKYGWDATCLTEDLEFTCKLVLNGHKVGWAHDASIYDEKPLTLKASWIQRKRWMQGFADVFTTYFFPLVKKGLRTGSWTMIDCAIYSIQPLLLVLFGIAALYQVIANGAFIQDSVQRIIDPNLSPNFATREYMFFATLAIQLLFSPMIMAMDGKLNGRSLLYYILYPIYVVTWYPIAIIGMLNKNDKKWAHTKHTRSIKLHDIDSK